MDLAGNLLKAYSNNTLKDLGNKIDIGFNVNSGNVYLFDEDGNVAMMNGDNLEMFYTTPDKGIEGFYDELMLEYEYMSPDDKAFMIDIKKNK